MPFSSFASPFQNRIIHGAQQITAQIEGSLNHEQTLIASAAVEDGSSHSMSFIDQQTADMMLQNPNSLYTLQYNGNTVFLVGAGDI